MNFKYLKQWRVCFQWTWNLLQHKQLLRAKLFALWMWSVKDFVLTIFFSLDWHLLSSLITQQCSTIHLFNMSHVMALHTVFPWEIWLAMLPLWWQGFLRFQEREASLSTALPGYIPGTTGQSPSQREVQIKPKNRTELMYHWETMPKGSMSCKEPF